MRTIVSLRKLTALVWITDVSLLLRTSRIYSFIKPFLIYFSEASSKSLKGPSIYSILFSLAIRISSERKFLLDINSKRPMLPNLQPRKFKNFKSFRYVLCAS